MPWPTERYAVALDVDDKAHLTKVVVKLVNGTLIVMPSEGFFKRRFVIENDVKVPVQGAPVTLTAAETSGVFREIFGDVRRRVAVVVDPSDVHNGRARELTHSVR